MKSRTELTAGSKFDTEIVPNQYPQNVIISFYPKEENCARAMYSHDGNPLKPFLPGDIIFTIRSGVIKIQCEVKTDSAAIKCDLA